MSIFNVAAPRVSRKDRQCAWCSQQIPAGERHDHFVGKWEGEFQNWRMHAECFNVYSEDWGEFSYGDNERPVKASE